MTSYFEIIRNSYRNYADYLWKEITFGYDYKPWWENYFYWLLLISAFFFLLEIVKPWRKEQPKFRKDFWLDFFYMYFNFFLFSLIVFNAASDLAVNLFNDFLGLFGITNLVAIEIDKWHPAVYYIILFIAADFIQWNVHRLLHRIPFLWEFHKVHHSVEQMGFAAHLRFHWMESVVYKTIQYIPLAMLGYGLKDFFIVHIINITIGHFNHSNFRLNIGLLKYILNNPQMHIWHHAHEIPNGNKYGVNYGLTLSVWDFIFGTAYIEKDGRDVKLGFPKLEEFPKRFLGQLTYGFGLTKSERNNP